MATTGVLSGNLVLLKVNDNTLVCSTGLSVSMSADVIDATCKDNNGARQVLAGQKNWSVSVDALQVWSADDQVEDMFDLFWAGSNQAVSWGTGITGDPVWTGNARISSLDMEFPLNDVCTFSMTFEGSGILSQTETA